MTRERDEEVLLQLRLRASGQSLTSVAILCGVPKLKRGQIGTTTERVKQADIAEAAFWGDTPEQATAGYW